MNHKAFTLIELLIVIAIIAILALIAVPNFMEAQTRAKVARVKADMRSIATSIEAYYVDYSQYPYRNDRNSIRHPYEGFIHAKFPDWYTHPPYNGHYPVLQSLTTPIAYITSFPMDPFYVGREDEGLGVVGTLHPMKEASYWFYNFDGLVKNLFSMDTIPSYWDGYGGAGLQADVRSPAPMRFNQGPNSNAIPAGAPVYASYWALLSPGPDRTHYQTTPGWTSSIGMACARCMTQTESSWRLFMEFGRCDFYDPTNGTVSNGDIWRLSYGATE